MSTLIAVVVVVGFAAVGLAVYGCRAAHRDKTAGAGDAGGGAPLQHVVATSAKVDQDTWDAVLAASVTGISVTGIAIQEPKQVPCPRSSYDNSDYRSDADPASPIYAEPTMAVPASPIYAEPTMAVAAHPNLSAVDFLWEGKATAQQAAVYEAATAATSAGYELASCHVDVQAISVYGNFDIIFDQFSHISQLRPTLHALCAVFYLVPMLIGW